MRVKAEGDPKLHLAFNSLSVSSTNPREVLSKSRGTAKLGENAAIMHAHLSRIFDDVSVSVLPGRKVDIIQFASHLREHDISIHSIDVPDVKHLSLAVLQATGNVLRPFILQRPDLTRAKNHIGWAISNVESRREQQKRTQEGLLIADTTDIKVNTEFWKDSRQGAELVDAIKRTGKTVSLNIEIDATSQTQAEYFSFMDQIRRDVGHTMRVLYDLDTGHLERSTHFHPKSSNKSAIEVLQDVFADPRRAKDVGIVSLNQYVTGNPESHTRLDVGSVKLEHVVFEMGKAMKNGKLPSDTTALLETHPSDQKWLTGQEGTVFLSRLQSAFDAGAGIVFQSEQKGAA